MRFETKKILQSAEAAQKRNNLHKAHELYLKALTSEPEDIEVRHCVARSHFELGNFTASAETFHSLHIDCPEEPRYWRGAGVSYARIGQFELSEQFLKKLAAKFPGDAENWTNLCFVAGSTGKHTDTVFYAMQALQINPSDSRAHSNLGSALIMMGRTSDALTCFETALSIEPGNYDALSNIGTVRNKMGDSHGALDAYAKSIELNANDAEFVASVKYRMSYDYLRIGDLRSGWAMYEYGFIPVDQRSRNPKRSFKVPRWTGENLEDQRLMLWREQGLGDELMFLGALDDVLTQAKHVIVECDPRLIAPLSRSFPEVSFRGPAHDMSPALMQTLDDYDLHLPSGSLMHMYRNELSDFDRVRPFVIPDAQRVEDFRNRLAKLPHRVKLGICWRSGALNVERNSSYTSISDWEPILRLPNVDFINLQYGDCSEELANVASHFGVTIHQWPDLDLKNDLDGVFALMSCLDHVVSVGTAVSVMAPAVGTETTLLISRDSWALFGDDRYRIFPNIHTCISPSGQPLSSAISPTALELAQRLGL